MQAEDVVRTWCGWHIAPVRTTTHTFRACDTVVLLPTLHLVSITEVIAGDGTTVLDPDDYRVSTSGILHAHHSYGWGYAHGDNHDPLTVTFEHGYEDVPPAVTAVVQALATRAISNPGSLVRTQVGPFSDTYSQSGFNQSLPLALLDAEMALLAPHRLPKRP